MIGKRAKIRRVVILLALAIIIGIICMQPAYAEKITVTVDKSKLYPSEVVSGSDSITVWSGYITVHVKYGDGTGVITSVKAISKGELVSSIENTNSAGKAVLPILTDTPPPLIRIWVKNPTTNQWFKPEAAPSIIDPVNPGSSPSSGGGTPRALSGEGSADAASPLAIPLFLILTAAYALYKKNRKI